MKSWLENLLVRFVLAFARLPYGFVTRCGECYYTLRKKRLAKRRAIAETNLRCAWPEASDDEIADRLEAHGMAATRSVFASLWMISHSHKAQIERMQIADDERLRELISRRSVIGLAVHSGCLEVHAASFTLAQVPTLALYTQANHDGLQNAINISRTSNYLTPYPNNTAGLRAVIKQMRAAKRLCWIPVDLRPRPGHGVAAPLFGRQVQTMTLASRLIQKFPEAAVIIMWSQATEDKRYRSYWRLVDDEVRSPDIAQSAAAINREVEQIARDIGPDFAWFYDRGSD